MVRSRPQAGVSNHGHESCRASILREAHKSALLRMRPGLVARPRVPATRCGMLPKPGPIGFPSALTRTNTTLADFLRGGIPKSLFL